MIDPPRTLRCGHAAWQRKNTRSSSSVIVARHSSGVSFSIQLKRPPAALL